MRSNKTNNYARYTKEADLGGLELLQAQYQDQIFSRHIHEGYCIGVIDSGVQRFYRSGVNHLAAKDSIILVNADQVHDGHTATEYGWSYRAMYPVPDMLAEVSVEHEGRKKNIPWFSESVIDDPLMSQQLRYLFHFLAHSNDSLSRETLYFSTLSALIRQHGQKEHALLSLGNEHRAVDLIREYIDAHCSENISLKQLAQRVHLSPFYLARLFNKRVGLPPHAYQNQRRILKAKSLIHQGLRLTDIAIECGFTDQSHLNRHFKKSLGISPGAYQKMVMN